MLFICFSLMMQQTEGALPYLLVLCGDHGMSETGSHGGSSEPEVNTPLVLISPAFRRKGTISCCRWNNNGKRNWWWKGGGVRDRGARWEWEGGWREQGWESESKLSSLFPAVKQRSWHHMTSCVSMILSSQFSRTRVILGITDHAVTKMKPTSARWL